MKNKLLLVLVFAAGGAAIWYTFHWGYQHAYAVGQPGTTLGYLAVGTTCALASMRMLSFGNSLVKRPGPRPLPDSPTSKSPEVA